MKTFKMMAALTAACLLTPAFVSCDKDDDDDPAVAAAILGTYSGSLGYTVMGYEPGEIEGVYDLKIQKDPTDADDVTVVIPQCSFTPPIPNASAFTIPSLTVSDVDVTAKGDVYTITEDDFSIEVGGTTYTGKLNGTITGKKANVEYTVRPGRMPMDINFTFTGTLK